MYSVKILWEEPFEGNPLIGILPRDCTVEVTFEDGRVKYYGYLDPRDIKDLIKEGESLNIARTYIKDFNYKEHVGTSNYSKFDAGHSFFDGNVDFSGARFGEGDVNFEWAEFGNGDVSFSDAEFGGGGVSFSGAEFGNGDVSFCEAEFGEGNVSFSDAKFGEGEVSFEWAEFGEGEVSFSKAEFGEGGVSFCGAEFGNGDVYFEGAKFGEGEVSFSKAEFGEGDIDFDTVKVDRIIFEDNKLFGNDRLNFKECNSLSIINCIIDGTLDLSNSNIDKINLMDTKNLGQIFIDWNKNKVKHMITNNNETSNSEKAYQFRLLKQNFNQIGQYDDEDKAYVEFKRYERKARYKFEDELIHQEKNKYKKLKKVRQILMKNKVDSLKWIFSYLIFDKLGGYGTKPRSVFRGMLITVGIFALLYLIPGITTITSNPSELSVLTSNGLVDYNAGTTNHVGIFDSVLNAFYYSGITFLTVGYGDIQPVSGVGKALSVAEGFTGIFLMSYFTVSFVRKLLR